MNRKMRIVAVTLTTLMLMTTTGLGIAAVQEAVSTTAAISVEAATAPPVSIPQTITPTASVTTTLPDLSKRPALPSLDKVLRGIAKPSRSTAQAASPALSTTATAPVKRSAPKHSDDSHESEGNDD